METTTLSEAAQAILRRRLVGEWVAITEDNKPFYRELAAAGLMYPVSGFAHGPESKFRFSEAGWALRPTVELLVESP
jgi:hypothetical protein